MHGGTEHMQMVVQVHRLDRPGAGRQVRQPAEEPHLAATVHLRLIQVRVEEHYHHRMHQGRYAREDKVMAWHPAKHLGYYPQDSEAELKTIWILVRQHHRLNHRQNIYDGETHRVPEPLKTTR